MKRGREGGREGERWTEEKREGEMEREGGGREERDVGGREWWWCGGRTVILSFVALKVTILTSLLCACISSILNLTPLACVCPSIPPYRIGSAVF